MATKKISIDDHDNLLIESLTQPEDPRLNPLSTPLMRISRDAGVEVLSGPLTINGSEVTLGGGGGGGISSLIGDVTAAGTGAVVATVANLPDLVTVAGSLLATPVVAPTTPGASTSKIYVDSTSKNLAIKDDAGVVKHGVQTKTAVANQFVTAISDAGVVSTAQPAASAISGLAAVATSGSAADLGAGTLPAARLPALSGDITSAPNTSTTTLANIPTHVTVAGDLIATPISAPGTPASGKGAVYVDSTSKNIAIKDDAGIVKHGVQTKAIVSGQFVTGISDAGLVTVASPAAADISGLAAVATSGSAADLSTGTLPAARLPGRLAGAKNAIRGAGAATASSTNFTADGAAFVLGDVGKTIAILGAGPGNATLVTTIAAYVSGTQITLTDAATTTVSPTNFWYGTNDFAALQSVVSAAGSTGTVVIPGGGSHLIVGTLSVPSGVTLVFEPTAKLAIPDPSTFSIDGRIESSEQHIFDIGYTNLETAVGGNRILTSARYANPAWWGAVSDLATISDAATTLNSPTVTSASTSFTNADIGKYFAAGEMTGGLGIVGRIKTVNSLHSVDLDAVAGVTGTNMVGNYGTVANVPFQMALATLNAAGGGRCQMPAGTFGLIGTISSYTLNIPSNVDFHGWGAGVSCLKLWGNSDKFVRSISTFGAVDSTLRDFKIDGNGDFQAAANNHQEQQHQIIVRDDTKRLTIENVSLGNSGGDGIFLYFQGLGTAVPQDTRIRNCYFTGGARTGIHAQQYQRVTITGCHFRDVLAQVCIKQEPDSAGQFGRGMTVSGCILEATGEVVGASDTQGILFAGTSLNPSRDLNVTGNIFKGLSEGVTFGVYSQDWLISGNSFDGCGSGIGPSNENDGYGFEGRRGIVITGNRFAHMPVGATCISVANTRDFIIANNSTDQISGGSSVVANYCTNGIVSNNVFNYSNGDGASVAVILLKCKKLKIFENTIGNDGASAAAATVYVTDTYLFGVYDNPAQDIEVRDNYVIGNWTRDLQLDLAGSPNNKGLTMVQSDTSAAVITNPFPSLCNPPVGTMGSIQTPKVQRIGSRLVSWGAVIPSSDSILQNWTTGDIRFYDGTGTNSSDLRLLGWKCTAGSLGGTWEKLWVSADPTVLSAVRTANDIAVTVGADATGVSGGSSIEMNTNARTCTLARLDNSSAILHIGEGATQINFGISNGLNMSTGGFGFQFASRVQETQDTNQASASSISIGRANTLLLTGSVDLSYVDATNWQPGSQITLQFNAAVTVRHNGGSPPAGTQPILFSNSTDANMPAGSTLTLRLSSGGGWVETARTGNIPITTGTAAAPGLPLATDTATGIYKYGANQLGFAGSGKVAGVVNRTSVTAQYTVGEQSDGISDGAYLTFNTNVRTAYIALDNATAQMWFGSTSMKFGGSNGSLADFDQTSGLKLKKRLQMAKGADIASANSITLGNDGSFFVITGVTQINTVDTTDWQAGSRVTLKLASGITVSNSVGNIRLRAGADLTTAAVYVLDLVYDGTNWLQPS